MFGLESEPSERAVVIGTADERYGDRAALSEVRWLADPIDVGDACEIQIRYRAAAVPAKVLEIDAESIYLELAEPARAITPGQSGVLYDGQRLLGGGILN